MHVCFIGDSLVLGTHDPEFCGWPGRLAAMALAVTDKELNVYNLGIRANRTNDILERWPTETARRLPQDQDCRLVFSFGGADASRPEGYPRVDAATSVSNARLIMQAAQAQYPVLWIGPTPMHKPEHNQGTAELNRGYAGLAGELDISYLDVFTPLSASHVYLEELQAGDGAHPGATGYRLIAELVAGWDAWRAWLR
ncbi:GDSL-type esterase/lipase family protein [Desulfocurvibacter africanus]|uniref:DUF459 domain-containing protein n=1 Tax=Desulfocurvibacter africanus TaxID=873 RepID=UPI000409449E|nr:GDSL-type esterase/lipase family protein [Desulfocurvibacter africanus]